MDAIHSQILEEYIRTIKTLLPLWGREEKRFLKRLRERITDYIDRNPNCSVDDIFDEFGKPNEIVSGYFDSIDVDTLVKRIRTTRYVKTAIAILIMVVLLVGSAVMVFSHKNYADGQDSYVQREMVEIE